MKKKTTLIIMALVMSFLSFTSCSDDDNNVVAPSNTIADFVAANNDYSSLLAALERADLTGVLAGTTEYTVFAPNNAAFDAFLQDKGFATLNDVPVDVLTQVLLNHVVSGTNNSGSLSTGYIQTLATEATTENNINMFVNTADGVVLNGAVTVTTPDVPVDNGVIHAVNAVIDVPTVVTFAVADATFTNLVAALTREDSYTYVATLSGTTLAPFTVFAPTDQAFVDLIGELEGVNSLADIPTETLTATLNSHVVSGANVLASSLMDGMTVTTLGDTFTINTVDGAHLQIKTEEQVRSKSRMYKLVTV
jgi:uncharacterized surface protein with fasciclin (FAS1) repeats